MGIDVKVTRGPEPVALDTAIARGMKTGGEIILAISDTLAPKEPVPKHGIHGIETGIVRVIPEADGAELQVGYGAFWLRIVHQHPEWHHPHGGESEFLLDAAVQGEDQLWETVATAIGEAFA